MKTLISTLLLALTLAVSATAAPQARTDFRWGAMELLPMQDRGRFKPFHTFATESVLYVTGKRHWKGLSATEVVLGWLIAFEPEWESEAFIRVDYNPLKSALGLETARNYFSPKEIDELPAFSKLASEVIQKERRKEKLEEVDKKLRQLINQKALLEAIVGGQALTWLPNPGGLNETWFSLSQLTEREGLPFEGEKLAGLAEQVRGVLESFSKRDAEGWNRYSDGLARFLRNDMVSADAYPTVKAMEREIEYNKLRPFRTAWMFYALAFVLLVGVLVTDRKALRGVGLGALALGFAVHCYGFIQRMVISGRPPVTNMYESVIWVSWGCILFAAVVWFKYRRDIIFAAASVFSVVSLVLADLLPNVLDAGIHPLEPVLRSNFWLTIHVLTITLSYAAFAVSLCLGNVVLGNILFRPAKSAATQEYSLFMYRSMQIGVVLLASGTILGGVWADYSWGRFWGWDPKEVWALVALLLYLAVLHGRLTGWLRGFGFAATTVVAFLGVLMAWYGVNFVLGVGLHSYGFGSGGFTWVFSYLVLQLGFIAASWIRYRKALAEGILDASIFPRKR